MRGWFVALLIPLLAGCIQADLPLAAADGAVDEVWWEPCDWQDHVPPPARGDWTERRVLHIAHQGGENEVPSNTMYALKTAVRKGADVLEIDVHATADNELVVIHDTTVDRTTDGTGLVEDHTLAELKALDAAHWFVPGRNAVRDAAPEDYVLRGARHGDLQLPPGCTPDDFAVPTLEEVLSEFPDIMINVEIKNGPPQGRGYEQILANQLAAHGRTDDTMVASFIDTWTETFRAFNTDVSTSTGTGQSAAFFAATQGPVPGMPALDHEALQVPIEFEGLRVIDEEGDFVADAHRQGLAVHVWTVNDPAEMHWLIDIGVDGIITAEPSVLEAVLAERGVLYA